MAGLQGVLALQSSIQAGCTTHCWQLSASIPEVKSMPWFSQEKATGWPLTLKTTLPLCLRWMKHWYQKLLCAKTICHAGRLSGRKFSKSSQLRRKLAEQVPGLPAMHHPHPRWPHASLVDSFSLSACSKFHSAPYLHYALSMDRVLRDSVSRELRVQDLQLRLDEVGSSGVLHHSDVYERLHALNISKCSMATLRLFLRRLPLSRQLAVCTSAGWGGVAA